MASCHVIAALACALLLVQSSRSAANEALNKPVPLCVMLPLTSPLDTPWPYVGADVARGLFLAIDHINAADCGVLGAGCEALLAIGGGRRLQIAPYVESFDSVSPQGAAKAVRNCVGTDAGVLVGTFDSEVSSQVASFLSALDRFLWSTTAVSPALSRKDLYPNFARSSPSQAELSISLAHYTKSFGWSQVAVMYRQDLFGSQLAEVFTATALGLEMAVDSVSIGRQTEEEYRNAAQRIITTGTKVVVTFLWPHNISEGMRIIKQVMDDEGVDFHSFTWINGAGNLQALASAAEREGSWLNNGLQGADFSLSARTDPALMALFLSVPSQELAARTLAAMNTTTPGSPDFSMATAGPIFNQSAAVLGPLATYSMLLMYDTIWSAAVGIAAATAAKDKPDAAVTGSDIVRVFESGRYPAFNGMLGPRSYLPNGDWDLNHTHVEIDNYGTPSGATEPRLAVVATIDLGTYNVALVEDEAIVWSNGREYPYVPADHIERGTWVLPVLVVCVVAVSLLGTLSICLCARNQYLKRHMNDLLNHAKAGLDLESPMAKTLEFLRRYQQGILRRPSAADAARLETLLISHSGAMDVPDLEAGIALDVFDSGIRNFLLANMQKGGASRRSWPELEDSTSTVEISMRGQGASLSGMAEDGNLLCSDAVEAGDNGVEGATAAKIHGRRCAGRSRSERLLGLTGNLRHQIGDDFFLDLVTSDSELARHHEPLSAVVEQSVVSLRLLGSPVANERLMRFTAVVEQGYLENNYHCTLHAADVTNRLTAILAHSGLAGLRLHPNKPNAPKVGLLGIVAAMVHDYRHPQVNNAYLIEQESPMAYDFNDQSVAEHYALRETMKLLRDDNLAFLTSRDDPGGSKSATRQRKSFRGSVIQMVLATDMSQHFSLLSKFETKIQRNKELTHKGVEAMWENMDEEQRVLVLQMALKVADIGHCALPMPIHAKWVQRLEAEFFAQGDLERAAGISPISALMDRSQPGPSAPQSQIGFFEVIVLPLFSAWVEVFPACAPLLEQVEANLAEYEIEVKRMHGGVPREPLRGLRVCSSSPEIAASPEENGSQLLPTKRAQ